MGIFGIKRTSRYLALVSAVVLCAISVALIALELSFLPQWVSSGVMMIDFYVYIAITGVNIILSVIEFVLIKKRSLVGMRRVFLALCGVSSVQFIVGLVHIGLLYSRYQSNLLDRCMRRPPPDGFWWSFGYQSMDDINKMYRHCEHDWVRFSMLRLFSCLVYGFLASLCLYFIQKYYYRLKRNVRSDLNKMVHASWDEPISPVDDDEKQDMEKQGFAFDRSSPAPHIPPTTVFYHSPSTSPIPQKDKEANEAIVFEKHAQRQKLYEEIAKRRQMGGGDAVSRASSFSSGKSSNRSSARYSHLFNVHPFDAPVNPVTTAWNPPSATLPTYDDTIAHDNLQPTEQQGLLANPDKDSHYRGWGTVGFDIDKVQRENERIDQQRREHDDDTFAQVRSRRSSKRHRKLSIVQQPQHSQFYPDDDSVSPLETSAEHWAQQQQQYQQQPYQYQPQELDRNLEPVNDETMPLNHPTTSSNPFEFTLSPSTPPNPLQSTPPPSTPPNPLESIPPNPP